MPRAYSPRLTTIDLIRDLLDRPEVIRVRAIAPSRRRKTFLRITMADDRYVDLSLDTSRKFLAALKDDK